MSFRCLVFFTLVLLAHRPASANTRFLVTAGMLVEHPLATSGHDTGSAGYAGATYSQMGLGLQTPFPLFGGNWSFQPTLSYTLPGRVLNDEAGRVNIWSLALPFVATASFFDFKIGAGIMYYQYRGAGGTSVIPNYGTDTTYYRPHDSVTSKVMFTDIGAGFRLGDSVRFDFDLYINGILSLRRDFTLAAQLGYFFL